MNRESENALRDGVVPSRQHYTGPSSSQAWLDLCQSGTFALHEAGKRLLREAAAILRRGLLRTPSRDRALDYISLGVGDFQKDRLIMRQLKGSRRISFWAVDVSSMFLENCLRAAECEAERVFPVLADFLHAGDAIRIENRDVARVVSFLGNTIGNLEQEQIFYILRRMVRRKDDILLVEVFMDGDEMESDARKIYENPGYREFLSAVVSGTGLDPADGHFDVGFGRLTACGQEVRVVRNYFVLDKEVVVEGDGLECRRLAKGYRLSLLRSIRYREESFCGIMSGNGFIVNRFINYEGVAVAICRLKT